MVTINKQITSAISVILLVLLALPRQPSAPLVYQVIGGQFQVRRVHAILVISKTERIQYATVEFLSYYDRMRP